MLQELNSTLLRQKSIFPAKHGRFFRSLMLIIKDKFEKECVLLGEKVNKWTKVAFQVLKQKNAHVYKSLKVEDIIYLLTGQGYLQVWIDSRI